MNASCALSLKSSDPQPQHPHQLWPHPSPCPRPGQATAAAKDEACSFNNVYQFVMRSHDRTDSPGLRLMDSLAASGEDEMDYAHLFSEEGAACQDPLGEDVSDLQEPHLNLETFNSEELEPAQQDLPLYYLDGQQQQQQITGLWSVSHAIVQSLQQEQPLVSVLLAPPQQEQLQQQEQQEQDQCQLQQVLQQQEQHQQQQWQRPPGIQAPVVPIVDQCPLGGGDTALEKHRMDQLKRIVDQYLTPLRQHPTKNVNEAVSTVGWLASSQVLDPNMSCNAPQLPEYRCWFLAGSGMKGLNWNPGGAGAFRAKPISCENGTGPGPFYALKRSGRQTCDNIGQKRTRIISHWVVGVRFQRQQQKLAKAESGSGLVAPSLQCVDGSSGGSQLGGRQAWDEPCKLPSETLALLTEVKCEKKGKEFWSFKTFPGVSYWQCEEVEEDSTPVQKKARSGSGDLGGRLTALPSPSLTVSRGKLSAWPVPSSAQQLQLQQQQQLMTVGVSTLPASPAGPLTASEALSSDSSLPFAPPPPLPLGAAAWGDQSRESGLRRSPSTEVQPLAMLASPMTGHTAPSCIAVACESPPVGHDAWELISAIFGPLHSQLPQQLRPPQVVSEAAAGRQDQQTGAGEAAVWHEASVRLRQLLCIKGCNEAFLRGLKLPEPPPSLPTTPPPAAAAAAAAVAVELPLLDEGAALGPDADSSKSKLYSPPFLHWLLLPWESLLWDLQAVSGPALDLLRQIHQLATVRDHLESKEEGAFDRLLLCRDGYDASGLSRACAAADPLLVCWLLGVPIGSLPVGSRGQLEKSPHLVFLLAQYGLPRPHRPSRELLLAFSKSGWLPLHEACRNGHDGNAIAYMLALEVEFQGNRSEVENIVYSLKNNKYFKMNGGEAVLQRACEALGYHVAPAPNGWRDKTRILKMLEGLAIKS